MDQGVPQSQSTFPSFALAGVGVFFASVCFGIVPYFARSLTQEGLAPHAIAFYRYVIAATVLLPFMLRHLADWRILIWGISAGAAMGLGWIGYILALKNAPVSTVGVLYMTYPVFTVIIAWLLFSDAPTKRALIAAGLILIAAIVAGNPTAVSPDQIPALLISLTAPLGFGFGICVLVHRLARIPPLARIASVSFGSFIALLPLMLASEMSEVLPRDSTAWLLVIGISLGTALVPQLIYTICTPVIGASRSAVIGSVELPTMFAVSILIFGEALTIPQATACALIILAIALTQSRATRNVTANIAKQ